MKKGIFLSFLLIAGVPAEAQLPNLLEIALARPPRPELTRDDIVLEKAFLYDQHTLADTFPYGKGQRYFQFDKMRERLFLLDSIQLEPSKWAVLQNRQNKNGESPLVKSWSRDAAYNLVIDDYGVSRFQSVALYVPGEADPERYGRDGALMKWVGENPDSARPNTSTDRCAGIPRRGSAWRTGRGSIPPAPKNGGGNGSRAPCRCSGSGRWG